MKGVKSWIKEVHVLFSKDDDFYIAHCLEFDIVADGKSVKNAKDNIIEAINNHIRFCIDHGNQDKIMNPAPAEYWQEFYFGGNEIINVPFKFPIGYKKVLKSHQDKVILSAVIKSETCKI